ncbi:MAG: NAD-dependent protein deacylase [Clostridia bacterium]|nr:NAD-dependent protein deacylase [Clostridia bacterium]
MKSKILQDMIKEAERIVFFGGAGVSTGSGIPDFRGSGGLYTANDSAQESPEEMLSGNYLQKHPEKFYRYYKKNMLYPNAKPNGAHRALAKLEQIGKLTSVVTQNIDGLHQVAGNRNVIELHGSVLRNYCVSCFKEYPLSYITESENVPLCEHCGNPVRPDVVLYGEGLDGFSFTRAQREIEKADLLIVGGTSLTVYPAAGLIHHFTGKNFVIINCTPTPYDPYATLIIREPIEDVLSEATKEL